MYRVPEQQVGGGVGRVLWNSSDGGDNLLGLKFLFFWQVFFGWIELSRVIGIQNNQ